jgi:peroxiredoxin Q/BCP
MGLKPGSRIPEFSLPDQDGNMFSVTETLKSKPLVLFFYPKDNTPGCIRQVCSFRDSYEDFLEAGAEVIGISSDSVTSHAAFTSKHKLPFRLLSDKGQRVRKQFQVQGRLFNLLPGRETYLIDRQGIVRLVFNSMDPSAHKKKALKALTQLKIQ